MRWKNKASEIIPLINGAAGLGRGLRSGLTVDCVVKATDDGKRNFLIFPNCADIGSSVGKPIVEIDGVVQQVSQPEPISSWVAAARHDPNVSKALRLFVAGIDDWVNLYRIYEVVESDVGGISNIAKKGWATKKAIERFKHTANSPGAIGDDYRHGKQTPKPPKDPTTLSEAKPLVKTILHSWLRMKGE